MSVILKLAEYLMKNLDLKSIWLCKECRASFVFRSDVGGTLQKEPVTITSINTTYHLENYWTALRTNWDLNLNA